VVALSGDQEYCKKCTKSLTTLLSVKGLDKSEPLWFRHLRAIVRDWQYAGVPYREAGKVKRITVDATTASAITQVYDKLEAKHKELFISKGLLFWLRNIFKLSS
jgi:hypothetical protein